MDLLHKIDKMIVDTTVAGDVATNNTKGNIDVVGGECPDGMHYCKKRKTCVPNVKESVIAGGTYASGNSTIAGSGQTRIWGDRFNFLDALETKEKVIDKDDDKTKENLGRPDLKFDSLLGAYVPRTDANIDTSQMENDDE
jgi:hypothetical protein